MHDDDHPGRDQGPEATRNDSADRRRQVRAAGMRVDAALTLAAVEQRRRQLWTVMSLVMILVSLAVVTSTLFPDVAGRVPVSQRFLGLGLPVVSLAFAAYGLEKERVLRRLTGSVIDDQIEKEQLSVQARQLRAALEAGRELSACLDPGAVVDTLLTAALDMFDASDGSLLLMRDGRPEVAATRGTDRGGHLDHDAIEAVAEARVPIRSASDRAMLVPLVALVDGGGVLGVLAVATNDRPYTDLDLCVLASFGEYAAQALVNARRFEHERWEHERLRALNAASAEFSWLGRDGSPT
ncbi:MAG: GAF domain-containing protein [Actinobacteria bacterium]|nr:GAF domain-containing protein [Actinomycetota bacterium]